MYEESVEIFVLCKLDASVNNQSCFLSTAIWTLEKQRKNLLKSITRYDV